MKAFGTWCRLSCICLVTMVSVACGNAEKGWTEGERAIIDSADSLLRVLTVDSEEDLAVLRTVCTDLSEDELASDRYDRLCELLINTVTSPEQDGVGISGPQVGISRNIVAVQRFDKEGEPFEVYPNISIVTARGEMTLSSEGCLSVPGKRGKVPRFTSVDVRYRTAAGKDTVETIQGFTAIIFQHECDHLAGKLYTDCAVEVSDDER